MAARRVNRRRLLSGLTVLLLVDGQVLDDRTSRFWPGTGYNPLANALRRAVEKVVIKPYVDVAGLLECIKDVKPDVVCNVTEHADWDRSKDSHICALLDLLKLPYTGTGPRGLMLCRDKAVSKLIAAREGFKTPEFFVVTSDEPSLPQRMTFPLVVKPRFGDGSEGISQASLVRTKEALLQRIAFLRESDVAEIICEEFIAGPEMIVGFIGERVMPAREFIIGHGSKSAPRLISYKLKHDRAYRRRWSLRTVFAKLTPEQEKALKELTLRTGKALDLRDYGRLDLKLTPSGEWVFLEANPNPNLTPFKGSLAGIWSDIDFEELIAKVLLGALQREH
jgi:D-alanine-D-alanine ligase